ncbi:MAG TPA: COX15/CtaA family protein [Candidatus Acidoferrales bacterium]|nr:COX15/CtaA family protein [Candidatus Acidoferrales bacterium]
MADSRKFIPHPSSFSPWPHRLALLTACATFPLLFVGGLVTSKGAGLAVPDWPTTFGYNMFLYPWSKMVGNIFYEHSHRLVASAVGLFTIGLALTFWLYEQRRWLRWLGIAALGLVIAQGVVGGLRVVLLEQTLAIVHAALAQAFFALTVSLVIFTSAEWRKKPQNHLLQDGGRLYRLCAVTTGMLYVQAIFGAVLRHTGERLDAHLLFAALIALHVILIVVRVMRAHAGQPALTLPALALGILLLLQITLGVASYLGKFTSVWESPVSMVVILTTTHLVTGALMLATTLLLTLRTFRLSASAAAPAGRQALRERFSI